MVFTSRKDFFLPVFIFGISIFFVGSRIYKPINTGVFKITDVVFLVSISFIVWLHYSTKYKLTEDKLIYKSGFIKGEIQIDNIREIVKGKTLWVGIKPATATKGLIIKYNKYDEVYISPKTNDSFVKELLKKNPTIKITETT